MTTLTIELPDELAVEVRNRGLLVPDAVEAMIRERLRASAATELLEAAEQLAAAEFSSLTMAEIQEEVKAVRRERRRRAAGA
jgi:post-segregation antitoxin (ccd killing protein)